MVTRLKVVWTLAICAIGLPGAMRIIKSVNGVTRLITTKMAVPMMLNSRWMAVARFAFLVVPMEARTAVMQVPIYGAVQIDDPAHRQSL